MRLWLGTLCLSLAAAIWGGVYVVSKYVMEYIPPLTLLWIRYVIAVVTLVLAVLLNKTQRRSWKIEKQDLSLLFKIGFVGYFISIGAQFVGTYLSNASMGALITSSTPAFVAIFAFFLLKEKLTFQKIISIFIATVGVVIVVGFDPSGSNFTGNLVLLLAGITWALYSVYVRMATQKYTTLMVTIYGMLFSLIFTTPTMLWELSKTPVQFSFSGLIWLGVLYTGIISTALAFFLWNKGFQLLEAGTAAIFFFVQPVVGALLGWLLLGEELSLKFFIGGGLIFLGVILATLKFQTYLKREEAK
ncbi:EamA family transporter [Microaerobacter geothermalis]|uniref:DMT family transporter n=1 Tax=Microaerobacter geothermalis TaxID=674972 RepID=UPI001F327795|nr:EamA family transporter [Microaerobacter geothermalis]MCF6092613.1 EamA family transporter [Microaerobacter geothermalis]